MNLDFQINVFVILFAVATANVYFAPVYSVSASTSSFSEPVSTTTYSTPAYSTEKYVRTISVIKYSAY